MHIKSLKRLEQLPYSDDPEMGRRTNEAVLLVCRPALLTATGRPVSSYHLSRTMIHQLTQYSAQKSRVIRGISLKCSRLPILRRCCMCLSRLHREKVRVCLVF